MSRPHPRSLTLVALFVLGCAQQAEGERCELSNDNNDCESGLVCTSLSGLTGQSTGAVCCPPKGQPIHVDICGLAPPDLTGGNNSSSSGDDDTSSSGTSNSPAPTDAGSDAGG